MAGDREESKIPITTVVGLAMALATLWLVREPLLSSRPVVEPAIGREAELIQARLWQDPIEAAESHQQSDRTEQPRHNHSFSSIHFESREDPGVHIGVLIIITEGSPYAENHEKRLRDRYAALSALGVACLVPADEERIGYFEVGQSLVPFEWYKARKTRQCHQDKDYKQHYDRVLLVWATDDSLGERPLNRLNKISGLLASQYWADVCGGRHSVECMAKLEFKIIGPPSSSMLRVMLQNARDQAAPKWWPNIGSLEGPTSFKIALYSPWATASPELLLQGIDSNGQANTHRCEGGQSCRKNLAAQLANAGVVLEHTVEGDEEMSLALVGELGRRQVKIGEDPIALIGEWDTFYGRALPIVFRAAACVVASENITDELNKVESMDEGAERNRRDAVLYKRFRECQSISRAIRSQIEHPERWDALEMRISRYSYLRGLDGLTPGASKKSGEAENDKKSGRSNSNDKKHQDKTVEGLERPDGESQLDYLRRLVARMKQDADEASGSIGKPPKAIGVLGSDVYDTLLILRAVREEFPNAIFFTTDLDARLLQERESKWARNLVVASPFGLNLHSGIQHDIPPFRNSYQTSGFFTMLRALGHIRSVRSSTPSTMVCPETGFESMELLFDRYEIDLSPKPFSALLCPRLFEVGRHGPVDLSADRGAVPSRVGEIEMIQPPRELFPLGMRPWWKILNADYRLRFRHTVFWLLVAVLVSLVVFTQLPGKMWNWAKGDVAERVTWHWRVVALTIIASVGAFTVVGGVDRLIRVILEDRWEGEPFSISDGVSTWPSIIIRSLVIAWCLGCLVRAYYALRSSQSELKEEFALPSYRPKGSLREQVCVLLRSIIWIKSVPQPTDGSASIARIWHDYSRAALYRNRVVRSLSLLVIYLFLIFIILAVIASPGPPSSPCRGITNCKIVAGVTWAAVLSMVFLNMFVFDAVLLSQSFITRLKTTSIRWPDKTLAKFHSRFELDRRYLPGLIMVRCIADQTHAVHKLVFCPFIALFFMILSRNRLFDNWDFPLALIMIWLIYAGLAAGSTIILRSRARQARDLAIGYFREHLLAVTGMGTQQKVCADQLRLALEDIEHVQKGAYTPLVLNPVFSASILAVISFLQYWYLGQ